MFQDPRINGYPPAFHAQLRRDDLSPAEWDALLAGFGVSTALLTYPDENPRAAYFDPERWALVYRAADGLVFVRRQRHVRRAGRARRAPGDVFVQPHAGRDSRGRSIAAPRARRWPIANGSAGSGDFFVEAGDDARAIAAYRSAAEAPRCLDAAALQAARLALGDAALRQHDPAAAVDAYAGNRPAPRAHQPRPRPAGPGSAPGSPRRGAPRAGPRPNDADAQLAERLARERLAKQRPCRRFRWGARQR